MADRRDLGLKVTDAIRLNDFAHRLAEDFAARPPVEGDEWIATFWTNDASPEGRDWMHRSNTKLVAQVLIAKAVRDGILELWVRLAEGEASVDHFAIQLFTPRDVAAGAYIPYGHNEQALYGRPLWVKNADWSLFRDAMLQSRYAEDSADAHRPSAKRDERGLLTRSEAAKKLPPLSPAQLKEWWRALDDEQRQLPQDDLWTLCLSAFPGHHIARQRVRALAGPRKPGRKPIRHKPTAR
jgi:hypothetical protein